ncbi:MAG: hypothetical protein EB060_01065 [Proteobacteria bacterium]|nr:hypothetical protein [Pseudomonadota bacterium]
MDEKQRKKVELDDALLPLTQALFDGPVVTLAERAGHHEFRTSVGSEEFAEGLQALRADLGKLVPLEGIDLLPIPGFAVAPQVHAQVAKLVVILSGDAALAEAKDLPLLPDDMKTDAITKGAVHEVKRLTGEIAKLLKGAGRNADELEPSRFINL